MNNVFDIADQLHLQSAKQTVSDWTAGLKKSPDADSESERAKGKKHTVVNNLGS